MNNIHHSFPTSCVNFGLMLESPRARGLGPPSFAFPPSSRTEGVERRVAFPPSLREEGVASLRSLVDMRADNLKKE